ALEILAKTSDSLPLIFLITDGDIENERHICNLVKSHLTNGLFSASHVLGNALAHFLPEDYIFEVSVALLVFCPLYMYLFLVETVKPTPRYNQHSPCLQKAFKTVEERYNSMRHAAIIVLSRYLV
ncbi:hypothetical protein U1Q18_009283, partial [Sarracenia purpurea var. burkii]